MSNIPSLRLRELKKHLESYQISFRSCKGSEYLFEGKKKSGGFVKHIIAGPENREVPRELLKNILRKFEIDVNEFIKQFLN